MRLSENVIIDVQATAEEDGEFGLIPYGRHYGKGRDVSLQPEIIETHWHIASQGQPQLIGIWAKGTRVKHLKAGLQAAGRDERRLYVFDLPPEARTVIKAMGKQAAAKWTECSKGSA